MVTGKRRRDQLAALDVPDASYPIRASGHQPSAVGTERGRKHPGAHRPQRFPSVDVPHVHAAVRADDRQAPSILAECEGSRGPAVANQSHGAAVGDVAHLYGSVRSTDRRTPAVAADRHCRHRATGLQRRLGRARFADAPHPHRPVCSGADYPAPVLTERDGRDLAALLSDRKEVRLRSVSACGRDGHSVRAERNVGDPIPVAYERHAQGAVRFVDPRDSISARGCDPLTVRAEDRAQDEVLRAGQHADECTRPGVPDASALVGTRGDDLAVGSAELGVCDARRVPDEHVHQRTRSCVPDAGDVAQPRSDNQWARRCKARHRHPVGLTEAMEQCSARDVPDPSGPVEGRGDEARDEQLAVAAERGGPDAARVLESLKLAAARDLPDASRFVIARGREQAPVARERCARDRTSVPQDVQQGAAPRVPEPCGRAAARRRDLGAVGAEDRSRQRGSVAEVA